MAGRGFNVRDLWSGVAWPPALPRESIMDNTSEPTTSLQDPDKGKTPDTDLTGRTISDFQILRRLGSGGMGDVYLAEQLSLKRKVALKILRPDLAANVTSLARFKSEAHAIARVTHA